MPYLKIQTNSEIAADAQQQLLKRVSKTVAERLGKPERYVMTALEQRVPMTFAGDNAPTAYLELKSIGLPADQTPDLSQALCSVIHEELGIALDRVYIEFSDAPRAMWGWNGGTF